MTRPHSSPTEASGRPGKRRPGAATVAGAVVLVLMNLITVFCVYSALSITPQAAWDDDALTGIATAVFFGEVFAVLTALFTIVPVRARWLSRWWFVAPVVLFAIAWARGMYADHVYPE